MTVLASVDDYLPEAGALDRALLPLRIRAGLLRTTRSA